MITDMRLICTDDLLNELKSRYDSTIFIAVKDRTAIDEVRIIDWRGGKFACLGLVEYTKHRLMLEVDEELERTV
jgi:hypothetical protein